MREIYLWTEWFTELAGKIAEGGEAYLANAAREVNWRDDGKVQPLLNYGDENIDPFSFFYTLAQRGQDIANRKRVYPSIKKVFNMESQPPIESEDGFIFPTPPYNASVLFHDDHQGNPKLLWNLFRCALRGFDSVAPEDFDGALMIRHVGKVKLTQTLFLINPSQFIPCDGKMDPFVDPPASEFNWGKYREWLHEARELFPGCDPYEINLFAYLHSSGRLPVHADRCFQVSTEAQDLGKGVNDFWNGTNPELEHLYFEPNSWVFPTGPGRGNDWTREMQHDDHGYPLRDPRPGDVILVRTGQHRGRGIGIVYKNDYQDRLVENSRIHVVWVNRESGELTRGTPRPGFPSGRERGFSRAWEKTTKTFRFTQTYGKTFALLDRLSGREGPMVNEENSRYPDAGQSLNQIFYGPPGTGKTYQTVASALAIIDDVSVRERSEGDLETFHELRESGQVGMVTFHQNYAYEDFIEGIRPVIGDESDSLRYELCDGIFKQIAKAAEEERDKRFVLIIDEINRGNIAKIFGELITLIEDSRRLGADDETKVTLPYSKESFGVPDNLYLIGTMNTADRSIQLLDTALRRRFTFVEMMPEPEHKRISEDVDGVNCQEMLNAMNERITALLDREHQIGHTYLMGVDTIEALSDVFQNKIFPLLQEYFFDDWSKIRAVLGGNEFVSERDAPRLPADLEQGEGRKIYERLTSDDERERWKDPEQYRRIYTGDN